MPVKEFFQAHLKTDISNITDIIIIIIFKVLKYMLGMSKRHCKIINQLYVT
jgi:hypothetical protein